MPVPLLPGLARFVLSLGLLPIEPAPDSPTPAVPSSPSAAPTLTILQRGIQQMQGHWQVDYLLKLDAPGPLAITPSDVLARVDGWVANSRAAGHGVPRRSGTTISGGAGPVAWADVIVTADDARRCRERVVLRIRPEEDGKSEIIAASTPAPAPAKPERRGREDVEVRVESLPSFRILPGGTLHARVRLEHEHFLHGPVDPLLGLRTVELKLGDATLKDTLDLTCERYRALPNGCWSEPPEDRRDTRQFVSAPDSLLLEAHVPGNSYCRFPDRPVRHDTLMRLSFWYLIAEGTQMECRLRLGQEQIGPNDSSRLLPAGAHERVLPPTPRWTKIVYLFRTEPQASLVSVDFRLVGDGPDIGEVWIDDVRLEPAGADAVATRAETP